jgi:hypothetical protein
MAAKKFIVELDDQERARLHALISKGKAPAKAILKARILLKADQAEGGPGWLDAAIVEALDTIVKKSSILLHIGRSCKRRVLPSCGQGRSAGGQWLLVPRSEFASCGVRNTPQSRLKEAGSSRPQ